MPKIRIIFSRPSRALAADHYEQSSVATASQQHLQLYGKADRTGAARARLKQTGGGSEGAPVCCRYRRHEIDAMVLKPAQHLIDRVPCLVRMCILVAEPRLPASF